MMNGIRFGGQSCDSVQAQLDAYVDNELLVETSAQVLSHLDCCGGCNREMELRSALKKRVRAASESVVAPPHLAGSIRQRIDAEAARERPSLWGRQFLAVAAVALVCLGGAVAYQLGHLRLTAGSQAAFIESLSARLSPVMRVGLGDHVHCAVYRKFPQNPPSVAEMTGNLGPAYSGLLPVLQNAAPPRFRVVVAHTCKYRGRRFVHLAARGDGRLLSLVIATKKEGETLSAEQVARVASQAEGAVYAAGVQRFEIAAMESRDHLEYVVSDLGREKNVEILTALAPGVREVFAKLKG